MAIIDQPLIGTHPECAGKTAAYRDVGCGSASSMHGPAVASLLVGGQCGTAPGARLYHAAAPSGQGPPFRKNTERWDLACARAEAEGILVLDCTPHRGFIGPAFRSAAEPERAGLVKTGFPSAPPSPPAKTERLRSRAHVPCSPRTTAEEDERDLHQYLDCDQRGLRWSIPYCAGVFTLGWQVRPELSGPRMRELLFHSAHVTADGVRVIDPPAFIEAVRRAAR